MITYGIIYAIVAVVVVCGLILATDYTVDRLKLLARGILWPVTLFQILYLFIAGVVWHRRISGPHKRLQVAYADWQTANAKTFVRRSFHEFVRDVYCQRRISGAVDPVPSESLLADAKRWIDLEVRRPK